MSFLGDNGKFELFNLKDMWGKIKDDPWRLLVGAGDPLSTKLWSGITGHKMEPLVDQLGGPASGNALDFGDKKGGVYGRAEEAGINTKSAGMVHDLAKVVAMMFGGQGLMGSFGGGGGAPGNDLGLFSNGGTGGMNGVGGGNMGQLISSQGGGTGAGLNWQNLMQQGGKMLQQQGQPQQPQAQPQAAPIAPPRPPPGLPPNMSAEDYMNLLRPEVRVTPGLRF